MIYVIYVIYLFMLGLCLMLTAIVKRTMMNSLLCFAFQKARGVFGPIHYKPICDWLIQKKKKNTAMAF